MDSQFEFFLEQAHLLAIGESGHISLYATEILNSLIPLIESEFSAPSGLLTNRVRIGTPLLQERPDVNCSVTIVNDSFHIHVNEAYLRFVGLMATLATSRIFVNGGFIELDSPLDMKMIDQFSIIYALSGFKNFWYGFHHKNLPEPLISLPKDLQTLSLIIINETVRFVIAHELGHVIDAYLKRSQSASSNVIRDSCLELIEELHKEDLIDSNKSDNEIALAWVGEILADIDGLRLCLASGKSETELHERALGAELAISLMAALEWYNQRVKIREWRYLSHPPSSLRLQFMMNALEVYEKTTPMASIVSELVEEVVEVELTEMGKTTDDGEPARSQLIKSFVERRAEQRDAQRASSKTSRQNPSGRIRHDPMEERVSEKSTTSRKRFSLDAQRASSKTSRQNPSGHIRHDPMEERVNEESTTSRKRFSLEEGLERLLKTTNNRNAEKILFATNLGLDLEMIHRLADVVQTGNTEFERTRAKQLLILVCEHRSNLTMDKANTHLEEFHKTKSQDALASAITYFRAGLQEEWTPENRKPSLLASLGECLMEAYTHFPEWHKLEIIKEACTLLNQLKSLVFPDSGVINMGTYGIWIFAEKNLQKCLELLAEASQGDASFGNETEKQA